MFMPLAKLVYTTGAPGDTSCDRVMQASISAWAWATMPGMVTGPVLPRIGPELSMMGIWYWFMAIMASKDATSMPKGGRVRTHPEINGRFKNASLLPATTAAMSMASSTPRVPRTPP
jgi:hypothetical protein